MVKSLPLCIVMGYPLGKISDVISKPLSNLLEGLSRVGIGNPLKIVAGWGRGGMGKFFRRVLAGFFWQTARTYLSGGCLSLWIIFRRVLIILLMFSQKESNAGTGTIWRFSL